MAFLILTVACLSLMVFTAFSMRTIFLTQLRRLPFYIQFTFELTADVYTFILFIVETGNIKILLNSLFQRSNHIIISLDIIVIFTGLILILYQTFKKAKYSLCETY